ncbi:hypothetical protein HHL08_11040 [Sphingobium sp. AR-3-1]|uniref:Uncharacterized protein n=1 Tax=Sphingobium psychrophilum TaxID=2728834 RepID=A0A7X9WVH7_9SPHN|nr:hypothetical protein [Sphingobium psychrophilum]NML10679.1 hypothetical protein [Sphingobium psychrophilum]
MEKGDNAAPPNRLTAANDNGTGTEPPSVDIDTALIRIAEAIGRHIARQHIRACRAANDNEPKATE